MKIAINIFPRHDFSLTLPDFWSFCWHFHFPGITDEWSYWQTWSTALQWTTEKWSKNSDERSHRMSYCYWEFNYPFHCIPLLTAELSLCCIIYHRHVCLLPVSSIARSSQSILAGSCLENIFKTLLLHAWHTEWSLLKKKCSRDCKCFWMGWTTLKNCLVPLGNLDSHLVHGTLGPPASAPNAISIGSAVFTGITNVTNTQTHTHTQADHATPSVARGRLLQCGLIISRYHSHRLLQKISITNLANDRTRMTTYLCVYNVETSRTTMYWGGSVLQNTSVIHLTSSCCP